MKRQDDPSKTHITASEAAEILGRTRSRIQAEIERLAGTKAQPPPASTHVGDSPSSAAEGDPPPAVSAARGGVANSQARDQPESGPEVSRKTKSVEPTETGGRAPGSSEGTGSSGLAQVVPVFLDALEFNLREAGLPSAAYSYVDLAALANRRRRNRPTNARKAGELISAIAHWWQQKEVTRALGDRRKPSKTGKPRGASAAQERKLEFPGVAKDIDLRLWISSAGSDKDTDSARHRARLRVEFLRGGKVLEIHPPKHLTTLDPAPRKIAPSSQSGSPRQPFDRYVEDFKLLETAATQVRSLASRFPGPEPFVFPDPPDPTGVVVWATPPGKWRLRERTYKTTATTATAVIALIVLGGALQIPRVAGAAYGHYKERTLRMLQSFNISAVSGCIDGNPVIVFSGSVGGAKPPLLVFRDGRGIGKIEAVDKTGAFEYRDTSVKSGEIHVYAVGLELPFTREVVTSGTVGGGPAPRCRGSNQLPDVSDIQVSPARSAPGQPVHFSVSAADPEGDRLTFDWFFGDDSTSEGSSDVAHVFTDPGWYDVRVTVRDGHEGVVDRVLRVGVAVSKPGNRPPLVREILVGPTRVRPGERVRFVASADDPDGDPLSYEWFLGSDIPEAQNRRVIERSDSFPRPGNYVVSVRVSDTSLATVEAQTTVVVDGEAPRLPRCEILLASPSHALKRGEVATFTPTGMSWQGTEVRLLWDFGDGTRLTRTAKGPGPEPHVFARDGIYDVVVALRQAEGATDVCTTRVTVGGVMEKQSKRPVSGRVDPPAGHVDTEFSFVASPPSTDISGCRFRWTFLNFDGRKIVEVPEIASPRHRQRLPGEGLWTVRYVVILPDNSLRGPYEVGDVEVAKR